MVLGKRETCSLVGVPLLETLRSAELWKGALICTSLRGLPRKKRLRPQPLFLVIEVRIRVY